MKNYKVLSLSLAAAAALMTTSCQNSDYLDINDNPNYVANAEAKNLFPSAEASTVAVLGHYGQVAGSFWCQYYTQGNSTNQYNTVSVYQVTTGSSIPPCTSLWVDAYSHALADLKIAIKNAEETGAWEYYVASKILMAYNFLMLTDSYGDIPFTEALNVEVKNPKFDDSKSVVYPGILALLDEALAKEADAVKRPSMDVNDFFFGGNMTKWCQFARSLKLKMYLKDYAANATAINDLLKDTDKLLQEDCAWTKWEDSNNHGNPFYEANIRQLNTQENVRACHTLLEFLKKNNDPRIIMLYNPIASFRTPYELKQEKNNPDYKAKALTTSSPADTLVAFIQTAYDGIPFGGSSALNTTDYPISNSSRARQAYSDPVYLMNESEALLMIAEAYQRSNNATEAEKFYNDAVVAGLNRWSDVAATVNVEDFTDGVYKYDGTLECIARQYWLTYAGANAYDGWLTRNRLGYPEIQANMTVLPENFYEDETAEHKLTDNYKLGSLVDPVATVLQPGQYPARLLYPTNTTMYNVTAQEYVEKNGNDLLKKLWWQK